jgi:hypothetical protein
MVPLSKYWSNKRVRFLLVVISVVIAIDLSYEYWATAGRANLYLGVIGVCTLLVALFLVLGSKSDNDQVSD